MIFGVHWIDHLVVAVYFGVVLYIGVYLGGKKTKNLGDFFVAGGKWGALISFIFVFASSLAGNEAVVVSGKAYEVGLAGVWLWWNFLFATPIYFLFTRYFKRARVYNLAEFLEMRFGSGVATLYAVMAAGSCLLQVGMILLAIGKVLAGITEMPLQPCIWTIAVVVSAYIFSGGMMSALLTDLVQGVMCLLVLGFIALPFVWMEAGGFERLQALPPETWEFTGGSMDLGTVLAYNVGGIAGCMAAPWIFNWIAVSKNERAGTQCAWAHLWKRVVTLLFAMYGIFFAILAPGLSDSEMGWGEVMGRVLPVGVGVVGLMLASFFAAAMSSTDSYAATSSAMVVDYVYRKRLARRRTQKHYLTAARTWAVAAIIIAAASTSYIDTIVDYVKLYLALLAYLGVPIYFAVVWRGANRTGMWASVALGVTSYLFIRLGLEGENAWVTTVFADTDESFAASTFIPTGLAVLGTWVGSLLGRPEGRAQLDRFFAIMNTPIGSERRLVDAGIRLPALIDAGLVEPGEEAIDEAKLAELTRADGERKLFGAASRFELYRRSEAGWYERGFVLITLACFTLIGGTWLALRLLFTW